MMIQPCKKWLTICSVTKNRWSDTQGKHGYPWENYKFSPKKLHLKAAFPLLGIFFQDLGILGKVLGSWHFISKMLLILGFSKHFLLLVNVVNNVIKKAEKLHFWFGLYFRMSMHTFMTVHTCVHGHGHAQDWMPKWLIVPFPTLLM